MLTKRGTGKKPTPALDMVQVLQASLHALLDIEVHFILLHLEDGDELTWMMRTGALILGTS